MKMILVSTRKRIRRLNNNGLKNYKRNTYKVYSLQQKIFFKYAKNSKMSLKRKKRLHKKTQIANNVKRGT